MARRGGIAHACRGYCLLPVRKKILIHCKYIYIPKIADMDDFKLSLDAGFERYDGIARITIAL